VFPRPSTSVGALAHAAQALGAEFGDPASRAEMPAIGEALTVAGTGVLGYSTAGWRLETAYRRRARALVDLALGLAATSEWQADLRDLRDRVLTDDFAGPVNRARLANLLAVIADASDQQRSQSPGAESVA